MNRLANCVSCLMAAISLLLVSCEDTLPVVEEDPVVPYFRNNPLPVNCDSLRVLAIGNSYSIDGTAYVGELMSATGMEPRRYGVYVAQRGSSSLENWRNILLSNDSIWLHRAAGNISLRKYRSTMRELLSQSWDIVVLQQFSKLAPYYDSYNPCLRELVDSVRSLCTNPRVTIAWQLTHTYDRNSTLNDSLAGDNRWLHIVEATRQMVKEDGIDVVIPTGTALQIARGTSLQTPYDLTRDHTHLCYGVGRYIAACTWVETLFKPTFGISVEGNTATHLLTDAELRDNAQSFISDSSVPVTEANRDSCQWCALEACRHPYSLR